MVTIFIFVANHQFSSGWYTKEVPFVSGRYTKGISFLPKMVYKRVRKSSDPGAEPSLLTFIDGLIDNDEK